MRSNSLNNLRSTLLAVLFTTPVFCGEIVLLNSDNGCTISGDPAPYDAVVEYKAPAACYISGSTTDSPEIPLPASDVVCYPISCVAQGTQSTVCSYVPDWAVYLLLGLFVCSFLAMIILCAYACSRCSGKVETVSRDPI